MSKVIPFSEMALRRIAQIIELKYQGIETENISGLTQLFDMYNPGVRKIRAFFCRVGCDQYYVNSADQQDTYLALAKIQMQPDGRDKLIRIIEQLCDTEEYFDYPENREIVIKQLNEVLRRYFLKVSMYGKVLTSLLQIGLDDAASFLEEAREDTPSLTIDSDNYRIHGQQKVFVCYSHKDVRWLKQLQVHLKPLERCGIIDLWNDTNIPPGAISRKEIENALESATIAVTLVSPDFIASDFISEYELPTLLSRAKTEGTRILSVILSHCLFNRSGLEFFQTVNPPTKPLSEMTKGERDRVWVSLAKTIQASLERGKP